MKVKILQWNVWYKENPKKILELVNKIKPDIFCGQEFIQIFNEENHIDTAKNFADQTGYQYIYMNGDTWDGRPEKTGQGNAIFSKFPILNKTYQYVQTPKHNPPNAQNEGRVYLELEVDAKGKKLSVGTTHLSYTHKFEITKQRKEEAENLLEIIKFKKNNYIFTADLNAVPDSYIVHQIEKYLKNAGPDYLEKTWTTKPFDYHGFKENDLNWRIDYSFVSNDIKVIESKIVPTDASDHLPILTTIEI